MREQTPHVLVNPLHHAVDSGLLQRQPALQIFLDQGIASGLVGVRRIELERRVRSTIGQITKERASPRSGLIYELDRGVGDQLGHITAAFHGFAVVHQLPGKLVLLDVPLIVTKKLIKSALVRLVSKIASQVPFPKQSGPIALGP